MSIKKITTFILGIMLLAGTLNAQMFWNQAAKFENGSYIAGPNTLSLNIVGSLTIEAWVYPTVSTGVRYIVFKGNASNGYYLRLNSNGTVSLGTDGINRITSTTIVPAGKWSHVAGSYNVANDEFKIFVNGLEDGSTVSDNAPNTNTDSLFIGKFGGNTFTGLMDEVRIWTKAVSPTMIRRSFRTSLTISNGQYVSLLFSMPFQRINSSGTSFTIQDLSLNPISVNPTYNRGVTAVDLSGRPSDYLGNNESLLFEGNNDSYAEIATNTLNSLTGAMTIEAWVNITGSSAVNQYIIHKNAPGGNGYRLMVNSSQKLSFSINNSVFNSGSAVIEYNRWYHVAWVVSASGASSLYINGNLDAFYGSAGTPAANPEPLYIGRGLKGNIDELRVFKFERTIDDIRKSMYESMDDANAPAGDCFVFNFDGSAWAQKNLQIYSLHGNTYFSNTAAFTGTSSPLVRADNINFREGFYKELTYRRIPETGTQGAMQDDSIFIPDNVTINDLNLYLSLNHAGVEQLTVTLISPTGQSYQFINGYISPSLGYNFTTIFDDQADSTLTNNRYYSLLPRIKTQGSINNAFSGNSSAGIWKLRINDVSGLETGYLTAWGIQINNSPVIGIQNISGEVPERFSLGQNYPNPFNPKTNIRIQMPNNGSAKLTVFDIAGKEVAVLVNDELNAGTYDVDFDGSNLASGTYFYKLVVGENTNNGEGFSDVKKMVLIK
ncbi:MAG TPA: proprotein convertase P-domain-containing protein [Ignavibacteria bacterium]|nr:proprotein convertase P-domain-containing protein [Ignavibacteria bacterium]HMQ97667.1 proprotein convertase P-domain-containing protein [Ignavibacteria bacterium]